MYKILLKKQLSELLSWMLRKNTIDRKDSYQGFFLYVALYIYIFVMFTWAFFQVALQLCEPLHRIGYGWLYFALMGLIATTLGVVGSIFTAYSTLYQAKDNELLLAMPIWPGTILAVRMTAVYAMSFLFEFCVLFPMSAVYLLVTKCSLAVVIANVLIILLLPLVAVAVSGVLGWFVAMVVTRVRRRTLVTVLISLGFIGVYCYFFMQIYQYMQRILLGSETYIGNFKAYLYPLYQMGMAAQGNIVAILIFTAIVTGLFFVVYLWLAKSFHKLATMKNEVAKVQYKEKIMKAGTPSGALLRKEFWRFCSSSSYLLNCGLGSIVMVIVVVFALIKADALNEMLGSFYPEMQQLLPLFIWLAVACTSSMNSVTAPSVSLEGNTLWLVRSLPVSTWQILEAKLLLHTLYAGIPAFIGAEVLVVVCDVMPVPVWTGVLIPFCSVLYAFVCGEVGLYLNLQMPNLNWTNEAAVVKQGMSVMLTLVASWVVLVAMGASYYCAEGVWPTEGCLVLMTVLLAGIAIGLLIVLKTKGVRMLEAL